MPDSSISLGVLLGTISAFVDHSSNSYECLRYCDSWVLKVNRIFMYLGFMMGMSAPGQVVYTLLKRVLNSICIQFNCTFEEHPKIEKYVELGLSFIGQRKLQDIWNGIREKSLCMKMNNCQDDHFILLSNFKLQICGVDPPENDDNYSASICEQIFNDIPLIALFLVVFGGWLYTFFTGYELDSSLNQIQPNPASGGPKQPDPGSGGPTQPDTDPPKQPDSGPSQPPPVQPQPQPPPSSSSTPSSATTSSPSDPKPQDQPNAKTQPMETTCPTCKKQFQTSVPSPMPIYCCDGCTPKNDKDKNKCKLEEDIIAMEVDKFMTEALKLLCPKCKKKSEEAKPPPKSVCLDCGHEH